MKGKEPELIIDGFEGHRTDPTSNCNIVKAINGYLSLSRKYNIHVVGTNDKLLSKVWGVPYLPIPTRLPETPKK